MSIFNQHQQNCPIKAPGLAIGSNDLTVENSNIFYYKIDGELYGPKSVANFTALTGISISTGYKAIVSFFINNAGVTIAEKGEEIPVGSNFSFGTDELPMLNDGDNAFVGFIIISNASGSPFVGGTTQLDASGITTTYFDNFGRVGM